MIGGLNAQAAKSEWGCGVREESAGHGSSIADMLLK